MAKKNQDASKWARIEVPQEFRLGINGIADAARLRVRHTGNQTMVATEERHQGLAPNLLRLRLISRAETATDARLYEPLNRWRKQDEVRQDSVASRVQHLKEINNPETVADAFASIRLQILTARDSELPEMTRAFFSQLATELPTSSLWAVEIDDALSWRVAACRMLFGAREHPQQLAKVHDTGERLTNPMSLLPTLGYGLDAFIEPALLVVAPWLIGMNAVRVGGELLFMFGQAGPGWTGRQADSPLELLRGRNPINWQPGEPDASRLVSDAWVSWWIDRLNNLLDLALDVANFRDATGLYDPASQLAALASLERVFAGVQAVLAGAQRTHGRMERMFDVVDQLNGLSFGNWENMLRPDQSRKHLAQLAAALPSAVHPLALARPAHAVAALDEFAEGFGPLTTEALLRVPSARGSGTDDITIDSAVHQYMRLIRNAGNHSFRKQLEEPRARAILASHEGNIPDGVADLALLHLLRFLVRPTIGRL